MLNWDFSNINGILYISNRVDGLIMQALLQDSKITIFDEPIANLDIKRSKFIFNLYINMSPSQILIVVSLLILSAFFSASELAIMTVPLYKIKQLYQN